MDQLPVGVVGVVVGLVVVIILVVVEPLLAVLAARHLRRGKVRRLIRRGAQRREREQAVEQDGLLEEAAQEARLGLVGHAVGLLPVGDGELGNVAKDLPGGGLDEALGGGAGGDEDPQAIDAYQIGKDVAGARDVGIQSKGKYMVDFLCCEIVEYGEHVRRRSGRACQHMEPVIGWLGVLFCIVLISSLLKGCIHKNVLKLIVKVFQNLGKSLVAASHFVKRAIAVKVGLPGASQ